MTVCIYSTFAHIIIFNSCIRIFDQGSTSEPGSLFFLPLPEAHAEELARRAEDNTV